MDVKQRIVSILFGCADKTHIFLMEFEEAPKLLYRIETRLQEILNDILPT